MAKNNSRFRNHGGGSTFVCQGCDRRTRDSGQGVDHMCFECYEIAGLDNTVNDDPDREKTRAEVIGVAEALLAKAIKLGSNGDAIKKANRFLWPKAGDAS